MIRNKPRDAAVYGIDIGKNLFHVVGTDRSGQIVQRAKFRRETVLAFLQRAMPAIVGMEACPGAQWLARKLRAIGHTVRVVPAQFVKPYVKSNKNDICQMRAFCLEHGVAIRQGAGVFKPDLPRVVGNEENDLTPTMRRLLCDLFEDLKRLEGRIKEVTKKIEALAARDERTRRLMTVPGIGPLGATALLASAGDAQQFKKARDMAAWLSLVPRQHSTGGKTTLLGISKRGNSYTRRLLIHGARSCIMHLNRYRDRLGVWLDQLRTRMHVNKVTVALAAKLARIAWVILTKPGALYERRDPTAA